MINNKKKNKIKDQSQQKIVNLNKKRKTQKDYFSRKDNLGKANKTVSSQKKSEPSRKKFAQSHRHQLQKFIQNKSSSTPFKKRNQISSKKNSKKKLQGEKKFQKGSGKQRKNKSNDDQNLSRQHTKLSESKKISFKKIYMPNDQYYGQKQEFMCGANTQQTLNDSRAFFSRYAKLVKRIKSLESFHKSEYQEFKNRIQQHELMRLIKIHSLQRNRVENHLLQFLQNT